MNEQVKKIFDEYRVAVKESRKLSWKARHKMENDILALFPDEPASPIQKEGFEVGKCYQGPTNIFRCDQIDNFQVIGETYNTNYGYEKMGYPTITVNYALYKEITKEEYEDLIEPHRPKPKLVIEPDFVKEIERPKPTLVIEPGRAYEYGDEAIIYVVEVSPKTNWIYGDCMDNDFTGGKLFESYSLHYGYNNENITKEIPLNEWFERTREHNPGWQMDGYYRSQQNTYVHIIGVGFDAKPRCASESIFSYGRMYLSWTVSAFFDPSPNSNGMIG